MAQLPSTYPDPIPIAIIGGTGLSSLPSPPFTPLAIIPPPLTPWGLASSPIVVLSYAPPPSDKADSVKPKTITIAFLARHGLHHEIAPHEVPFRANVATLRKLGVRCAFGFSAVGSLREEVKPRDFVVVDQLVDWTKGLRPRTFFEGGVVGHVSMASPYDTELSAIIVKAVEREGVLQGEGIKLHDKGTVICIEGPQFSTYAESLLFRSLNPPLSCINMSASPEASLFREAEIAFSLLCMSTDYDSWHSTHEQVSVELVMGHMAHNGTNARRVVEAVLGEISNGGHERVIAGEKWKGAAGIVTNTTGLGEEARARLGWLFEDRFG